MLAYPQREPAKRKQVCGRRETQVDVQTSSEIRVRPAIDSPASRSGASDPDLNRLLSEIANDRGALGSESQVRYHIILKVTGTAGFPEHRYSRKAPPAGELEETTAIVARVIHFPPEKRNCRLRHFVALLWSATFDGFAHIRLHGIHACHCP
jgi:hypothetical protein